MKEITPDEKYKKLEKDIEKAKLEAGVYQKQLKELLPQREAMEKECREKYSCEISELPKLLEKTREKLSTLVDELEKDVLAAQGNNPDDDDE